MMQREVGREGTRSGVALQRMNGVQGVRLRNGRCSGC